MKSRERVFRAIRFDGIIACGEIGPELPLQNIRAMYEAFASY
jgi:hypothetical protein